MQSHFNLRNKSHKYLINLKLFNTQSDQDTFTLTIQHPADKWWEQKKYQLGDYKMIQYQILQNNIIRIV